MQFSVPQFTEVEDKIIGPLTLKQFGIVFGAGIIIFSVFSITKSLVITIFFGLLVGLPALGLAFAKLNGRPMYNMIGNFVAYLTSEKVLIFHKQGILASDAKKQQADTKEEKQKKEDAVLRSQVEAVNPNQRIREINKILQEKAKEERELFNK